MISLRDSTWPMTRAGEALSALAREAHLPHRPTAILQAPGPVLTGEKAACSIWMESMAAYLDLQIERKTLTYAGVAALASSGPSLLQIKIGGEMRLVVILESARGKLKLLR